jgi:hypothetical protein
VPKTLALDANSLALVPCTWLHKNLPHPRAALGCGRECQTGLGASYAHCLGGGGSMSEPPSDELSIAATGADPGRRKAAAEEARGALGALRRRRVAFATEAGSEQTCKDAKGETNPSGQRPGSRRRDGPVRDGDRLLRSWRYRQ